jgi:NAD dependent epimerase/dehydratase family enzyme
MEKYYIRYRFVFSIHGNYHSVELYKDSQYSEATGLIGKPQLTVNNTSASMMRVVMRKAAPKIPDQNITVNEAQITLLRELCSEKCDGIINPEGKYLKN